jgi:AcrR family transcriptional regulator
LRLKFANIVREARVAFANTLRKNVPMPSEPIWLRPETAGVGRPAEHSRAEITEAAVAIAERDGFAKVSMRSVATALGTGAASLYRYVAGREELVELMVDHAYGEIALVSTDHGARADVVAQGIEGFRLVVRKPWLIPAQAVVPFAAGPNMARMAEHYLMLLDDMPGSYGAKMELVGMIGGMVVVWGGFIARTDVAELMTKQGAYFAHVAARGEHPRIAAMVAEAMQSPVGTEDPAATLERVLTVMVAGAFDQAGGDHAGGDSP